jgi:hypothetical protein
VLSVVRQELLSARSVSRAEVWTSGEREIENPKSITHTPPQLSNTMSFRRRLEATTTISKNTFIQSPVRPAATLAAAFRLPRTDRPVKRESGKWNNTIIRLHCLIFVLASILCSACPKKGEWRHPFNPCQQ